MRDGHTESLPAQLGTTINSVGVGDAFAAGFVSQLSRGPVEAAWRATYVATAYSQTTYPEIFRDNVIRDLKLTLQEMRDLPGNFVALGEAPRNWDLSRGSGFPPWKPRCNR